MMAHELNTTPDADLYAMIERGEQAQAILDERSRQQWRGQMEATSLDTLHLVRVAYRIETHPAAQERAIATYCGIPIEEIVAACPIPEGLMNTPADARVMLRKWDEYVYSCTPSGRRCADGR